MKRQLIACAVAMLLGSVGANADPLNIRISWVAVPNNLPPLFMAKPQMMQHAGKSYTVDPLPRNAAVRRGARIGRSRHRAAHLFVLSAGHPKRGPAGLAGHQ